MYSPCCRCIDWIDFLPGNIHAYDIFIEKSLHANLCETSCIILLLYTYIRSSIVRDNPSTCTRYRRRNIHPGQEKKKHTQQQQ